MVLPNFFTSAPQFFGCVFSQLRPATIILHKFKAHSRLRCLTGTPQKTLKRLAPGSKGHRQFGAILNLDTNFHPMIHFWTVKCPPENIKCLPTEKSVLHVIVKRWAVPLGDASPRPGLGVPGVIHTVRPQDVQFIQPQILLDRAKRLYLTSHTNEEKPFDVFTTNLMRNGSAVENFENVQMYRRCHIHYTNILKL